MAVITPRPAATLILCRDRPGGPAPSTDDPGGIEVLLVQRTHQAVFMPGVFVFPGGAVDPGDDAHDLHLHVSGLAPAEANGLLEVEGGGLGYLTAAVRECFEEAGILLGRDLRRTQPRANGCAYLSHESHALAAQCQALREQMLAGAVTMPELCKRLSICLPLDQIAYLSRWITPPGPPRRFDTRFFVAKAPVDQRASHDGHETIDHLWIGPGDAIERNQRGDLSLGLPTRASLEALAGFATADELMNHLHRARSGVRTDLGPQRSRSRPATGRQGRQMIDPSHPAYAEVEKLDPGRQGIAQCEILPGCMTMMSPTIGRITAPNPGIMTGPGTNTYVIGRGRDRAVIDPGPAIDAHLEAILAAVGSQGGQLRWILVTHTHRDHSPGAARLKAATGAIVLGMEAPADDYQDPSFTPDATLAHGERIDGDDFSLKAIHTPGHASNHICYLHEQDGVLFSGDHIMQGSTVVVNPPDGDMAAYMASLRDLKRENALYIAPGHGFLMDQPNRVIDRLIAHRQKREDKVIAALTSAAGIDEQNLVAKVYDDVPSAVHPLAQRSMLAHLYKLESEARVIRGTDGWRLLKPW
ncbi:MAG: MBL fold metallo-hydrolase [Alteromonadaceae bacterium]|nr:MBL fold metallo-hydrolase [Alteromonadaceae bacterium]